MFFSFSSIFANESKYEDLLKKSSSLSASKLVATADDYYNKGRVEEAMVLYMMVISRDLDSSSTQDVADHVKANLSAGDILYGKGNYSNALRFYVTGLKISESSSEFPYLATLYKNIGNVYNMFQDFEKGNAMYVAGLQEAKRVKDNETTYKLLQNLAGVKVNLGQYADARQYFQQSLSVDHKVTDEGRFMESFLSALLLKYEGREREAILQFKDLALMSRHSKLNARYECSAYSELGRIYNNLNRNDSAIYYLEKCREVAQGHSILYQYTESLKLLYTLYDSMGNHVKATEIKDRYLELKDSIYNQRQFDMAKNQQFLYEMEKTEHEIAVINEKQARSAKLISRQRIMLFSITGAVIITLFLIYFFYRQNRKLKDSYRNLFDIHNRLSAEQREARDKHLSLVQQNEFLRNELARLGWKHPDNNANAATDAVAEKISDNSPTGGDAPGDDVTDATSDPKYSGSALDQTQKDLLAGRITDVMESQKPFCSPDLNLSQLSQLVGSNSKYVSQVINDVFKKNFATFVNEYRINLACDRFANDEEYGNYSIEGIGQSVGFRSGANFTSVFKKITGISPSVYRKLSYENRKPSLKKREKTFIFF
ncbi:MAG: helix-turn-helix domain-containing protein [Lepagella sp.]